jgi:hypothetical protein
MSKLTLVSAIVAGFIAGNIALAQEGSETTEKKTTTTHEMKKHDRKGHDHGKKMEKTKKETTEKTEAPAEGQD